MRVMISCGEASGDLYAGALAAALRARQPDIDITGLGGPRLRAAGARLIGDIDAIAVTGIGSALAVVPRALQVIRRLRQEARVNRPDALVVIDAPDFNFPLVRAFRSLRIPVVYYISPQVWAWRGGRMATIRRHAARVLVIFPFEEAIYREAGVPVQFVGHPLVELTAPSLGRGAFRASIPGEPDAPIVALLPGSRANEVRRIAPVMAGALPLIRARIPDVRFVVAAAPALEDAAFAPLTAAGAGIRRGSTDDVLHGTDVAITASGTATVQCALHERPMVVVYRMSALDFRLVRPFVRVPHIAMPNLLAGTRIVPELVQDDFTPQATADATLTLLADRTARERTVEALRSVTAQLGGAGASARAAAAVLEIARS